MSGHRTQRLNTVFCRGTHAAGGRRRHSVAGVVLLLAVSLVGGCDQGPPEVVVLPADRKLAPNLRELIDRTVRAAQAAPDSAQQHGALGMVYEANGLYTAAAQAYANAASLDSENPSWPLHEAICHIANGHLEKANALITALLERKEKCAPGWYWLGKLRMQRGDLDGAQAAFRTSGRFAPSAPQIAVALADCQVRKGEFQPVVTALQPIVKQHSSYAEAQYLLGTAYKGLGNRQLAMRHLRQGLDAVPVPLDDAISAEVRGHKKGLSSVTEEAISALQQGKPKLAVQLLERTLQQSPGEVSLMNNLSSAYASAGNSERALEILDEALLLEPLNFRTHINRSVRLGAMGRNKQALAAAESACRVAPQVAEAHVEKARILLRDPKRKAEALPVLELAGQLAPGHHWVHGQLGEQYSALRRWSEAAEAFRRAMPTSADRRVTLINLTRAYTHSGNVTLARRHLRQLKRGWPDDPSIAAIEQVIIRKEQGQ